MVFSLILPLNMYSRGGKRRGRKNKSSAKQALPAAPLQAVRTPTPDFPVITSQPDNPTVANRSSESRASPSPSLSDREAEMLDRVNQMIRDGAERKRRAQEEAANVDLVSRSDVYL